MKRGFTLIELLVVVLIIGILAGVALLQYEKAVEKSRVSEALTMVKSILLAQEAYYLANGTYATDLADLDLSVPGEDTTASGTPSKIIKNFHCRAVSAGTTTTSTLGYGVCRRIGKPYAIYAAKDTKQLTCYYDNAEGEKLCRFLTNKQTAPYTF